MKVLLAVLLIASLYLPMLGARFDFSDDGNLVYPAAPMPLRERLDLVWTKIVANYTHLGPFRPTLWAHWEVEAELLRGGEFAWRAARLVWLVLATATLVWFFRALHVAPLPALAAAAIGQWTPSTGEIWRSLTLSEGVAMPYAVAALVCAVRAGRSRRHAAGWDVAGVLCLLIALGCKNTFAALVPAQMLLRVAPDGEPLGAAWRAGGRRAALLAAPLLLPAVHFVVFQRNWHAGQYEPGAPTWAQLWRMLQTVKGGAGLEYVAPGLLAAVLAVAHDRVRAGAPRWGTAARQATRAIWDRHRAACRAGLALLVSGVAIYLPMQGSAGRYAIPAVWGLLLLIAALLDDLLRVAEARRRRIAGALLAGGLAVMAGANSPAPPYASASVA